MSDASPEVLIVGAGPAGLTAATYLARFRRRVLVADGGAPRACWIPVSHNMPGFPEGITGDAILKRMTGQAREYGAVIEPGRVEGLGRDGEGFVARINGREVYSITATTAGNLRERLSFDVLTGLLVRRTATSPTVVAPAPRSSTAGIATCALAAVATKLEAAQATKS